MAIKNKGPSQGLIVHSDRGNQHFSHAYHKIIKQHHVKGSMSGKGNCKLHRQSFTPFKKPHGGQLLELCKQANQYLAKFRIMVEPKIGLVKLFKIVAHKYRNRRQRCDLRMKLFAGVVNFELVLLLLQEVY